MFNEIAHVALVFNVEHIRWIIRNIDHTITHIAHLTHWKRGSLLWQRYRWLIDNIGKWVG